MKIAIVHEMLIKLGGAERVLEEFIKMYPEADVFTLMYDEEKVGKVFPKEKIHCTGPAQWLYKLTKKPRVSLPLMTFSVARIDLSGYDLIISSSSGFAHGVGRNTKCKIQNTKKRPFHICYCHSPARYLWDWSDEIQAELGISKEERKNKKDRRFAVAKESRIISFVKIYCIGPLVRALFAVLRKIDLQASQSPDIYIANSREVQDRIQKYYKRDSLIIYPPVDTEKYKIQNTRYKISERNFYVITSALTPFKRVDIPIRVLSKLRIPLKIIGAGAQADELKELAGHSVEFLGRLSDEEVVEIYKQARGFLMPQKEDAGMAPIEAMAAGLPVFGQAAGGLLETNIDGITGEFFPEETDESFEKGFIKFHENIQSGKYDDAEKIVSHASQFGVQAFRESMEGIINFPKLYELVIAFVDTSFGKKMPHFERTVYWLEKFLPNCSYVERIAAYGHDIERAFRDEESAAPEDYLSEKFLHMHQTKGALIISDFLRSNGVSEEVIGEVVRLVSCHEIGGDNLQNALMDADSVSFFETNAETFVRKKVLVEGVAKVLPKLEWMYNRIHALEAKNEARKNYEYWIGELKKSDNFPVS